MMDPVSQTAEYVANNWEWLAPTAISLGGGAASLCNLHRRSKGRREAQENLSDMTDEELKEVLEPHKDEMEIRDTSEYEGSLTQFKNMFNTYEAGKKDVYFEEARNRDSLFQD